MVTATLPVSLFNSAPIEALRCQHLRSEAKSHLNDVLLRAQAGDPDAFSQLYLLHNKRVLAICIRMVRDFSLAEDLTQETFLQLHRKLISFRGESLFTTWLHRMTVNIVLMHLRKNVLPVVSLDQMMTDNHLWSCG
jgi:DNA-directed RNA polymerase specialized sigma24 family protein